MLINPARLCLHLQIVAEQQRYTREDEFEVVKVDRVEDHQCRFGSLSTTSGVGQDEGVQDRGVKEAAAVDSVDVVPIEVEDRLHHQVVLILPCIGVDLDDLQISWPETIEMHDAEEDEARFGCGDDGAVDRAEGSEQCDDVVAEEEIHLLHTLAKNIGTGNTVSLLLEKGSRA